MIARGDLVRVDENVWEIPRDFREDMRAPARLYADDQLLDSVLTATSRRSNW
jgi:tRNA-splicing ligase RtcB